MVSAHEKYDGKPVVFIAVNSGNSESSVKGYLRSAKVKFPGIVDEDRSFEKAMNVGTLSLRNVWQTRVIRPDGSVGHGSSAEIEKVIDGMIKTAKWKVDPETVPPSLNAAWKAVEFGDYMQAIPQVNRYLKSRDEKTKAAADQLNGIIDSEVNGMFADAEKAEKDDNKWLAYKTYDQIAMQFRGHTKAREAQTKARTLAKDKELADEVKAMNALKKVKAQLTSRSRSAQRTALAYLQEIAKRFPDTEAGIEAQTILDSQPKDEKKR